MMKGQHKVRSLIVAAGLVVALIGSASMTLAQVPTPAHCPGAPLPQLQQGFKGIVTPGAVNNVRTDATLSADLVGTLQPGQVVDVIDGPRCTDGYSWWMVSSGDLFGYTVEGKGSDYYIIPYAPTPFATEEAGTVSVDQNDVQFSFDSGIAPAVSVDMLPEYKATPDGPGWGIAPAGVQFTLFDGSEGSYYPNSTVSVYPAAGFAALDERTGKALADLKTLIANQSADSKDQIPEVPIINAGQIIRGAVKYLTLADGGKGLRFLTFYAQDLEVASNENMHYEFRGFSADGSIYVAAQFAVRSPALPDTVDYQEIGDKYSKNDGAYDTYLADITKQLTALPADQFTPNLDQLDALFASMHFPKG